MDDGFEALVGFVGSHGNTLELLELAEEVLDGMAPFVHFGIERQRLGAARMLGDDDLCAALVEVSNDGVAIEGLVGDQCAEIDPIDEWRDADRIEPVAGQQNEAHEIAERICPTIPARCSLIAPIAEAVFRAKGGTPRIVATGMWGRGEAETLKRLGVWNKPIHRIRGRIEKIFGTWKRSYGLRRMRWRGLAKAAAQVRLTAIAYNLKRTLSIVATAA